MFVQILNGSNQIHHKHTFHITFAIDIRLGYIINKRIDKNPNENLQKETKNELLKIYMKLQIRTYQSL